MGDVLDRGLHVRVLVVRLRRRLVAGRSGGLRSQWSRASGRWRVYGTVCSTSYGTYHNLSGDLMARGFDDVLRWRWAKEIE